MDFFRQRNSLHTDKNWFRVIGGVAAVNITLAVVSFLKDVILAAYMGTSSYADILLLAFFIPDTIGNNLVGNAIGVACIPLFSVLFLEGNLCRLRKTVDGLVFLAISCFGILLLFVYSFLGKSIIRLIASGLDRTGQELCLSLFYILIPIVAFFPIQNIYSAVLQAKEKFIAPSASPIIFNAVFLTGIIFSWLAGFTLLRGVYIVAFSIILGVCLMLTFIVYNYLKDTGFEVYRSGCTRLFIDLWGNKEELRPVLRLFAPYMILLLSSQAVLFVERYIATGLGAGNVSGLNYAYRLAQFPSWVFVSAVSIVILPSMAKSEGLKNIDELVNTMENAVLLVLMIALPLTLAFYFLRVPIVSVLLQRGAFNQHSVNITSGILEGYSITIVFSGISAVCLRTFLAVRKIWLPAAAFICSSLVSIGMDFFLAKYMGNRGLGYGAAAGAIVNSAVMICITIKEFDLDVSEWGKKIVKIVAANLLLSIFLLLFNKFWFCFLPQSVLSRLAFSGIAAVTCSAVYWLSLRVCNALSFNI